MKKSVIAAICGVAVFALGTTAFAASGSQNVRDFFERVLVKSENGNTQYSTDDGETWNEGLPEGQEARYSLDDGETWNAGTPPEGSEGKAMIQHGTPPAGGVGDSGGMMVENKDGVIRYSADGGKTWSEEAPEGVETIIDEDGKVTTMGRSVKQEPED